MFEEGGDMVEMVGHLRVITGSRRWIGVVTTKESSSGNQVELCEEIFHGLCKKLKTKVTSSG
jgi:hypothetical protein